MSHDEQAAAFLKNFAEDDTSLGVIGSLGTRPCPICKGSGITGTRYGPGDQDFEVEPCECALDAQMAGIANEAVGELPW